MNEITKILEKSEKVAYEGKPEYAPYIVSSIFGLVLLSVFVAIFTSVVLTIIVGIIASVATFALFFIISNLAYKRIHYAITNKRAIIQSGLIGRDFRSVDYDRMQNVSVDVGLLGLIFKVGTVKIYTGELESGGKNQHIRPKYDQLRYVATPYEVMKKLQTHLSARKEKLA